MDTEAEQDDPYDRDDFVFRTDGRDVCHWCYLRPQAWVWGPFGTRVCDHCQQMINDGRARDVVEELAARMTVRHRWSVVLDEEQWREREHRLMARWVHVRTECRAVDDQQGA